MATNIISVKCPECGAVLQIEEGRKQAFCTYCGAKVLINNDNEHIYRHIDEAGIKQAETEQLVMLKKLELIEKKRAEEQKITRLKIGITVLLGVVMIITFAIAYSDIFGPNTLWLLMVGLISGNIIFYMWLVTLISRFRRRKDNDIDLDYKL